MAIFPRGILTMEREGWEERERESEREREKNRENKYIKQWT